MGNNSSSLTKNPPDQQQQSGSNVQVSSSKSLVKGEFGNSGDSSLQAHDGEEHYAASPPLDINNLTISSSRSQDISSLPPLHLVDAATQGSPVCGTPLVMTPRIAPKQQHNAPLSLPMDANAEMKVDVVVDTMENSEVNLAELSNTTTEAVANTQSSLLPNEANSHPMILTFPGRAGVKTVEAVLLGHDNDDGSQRILPLTRSQQDFSVVLNLPLGTHRFRFLVNGTEWRCNHEDFESVLDEQGNLVNYVEVGPGQSEPRRSSRVKLFFQPNDADQDSSKDAEEEADDFGEYGQVIPENIAGKSTLNPSTAIGDSYLRPMSDAYKQYSSYSAGSLPESQLPPPPLLPQILEKSLLNVNKGNNSTFAKSNVPQIVHSTTDYSDVNFELPVPAQVCLHHLYALSTKDGVMGLSVTRRYRGKYVTLVLYRPAVV